MADSIYLLAGGGTGGHLYPGLAVAERIAYRDPWAKIVFVCSQRAVDRRILDPCEYGVVVQPVRPLPRGVRGWGSFLGAWAQANMLAGDMIRDLRPKVILGLGGFAAGPLVRRAAKAGVRTALLNPDVTPGLANRYLAGHVYTIFTQFDSTAAQFAKRHRHKVRHVGCPVRGRIISASRAEAIEHFGLRAGLNTLVVLGGSTGADSINQATFVLMGELDSVAAGWQMIHIVGPDRQTRSESTGDGRMEVRCIEYCDRMDLVYAVADLVVSRGGASTVAELAATGTASVLMPYPHHRDDHQRLNAAELAGAGAAVVVEDDSDAKSNARRLGEVVLPLLANSTRLEQMSRAARGWARSDAAERVAAWLCD